MSVRSNGEGNKYKLLGTSVTSRAYTTIEFLAPGPPPRPHRGPKMTRATKALWCGRAYRSRSGPLYLMKLPIQRKPSP